MKKFLIMVGIAILIGVGLGQISDDDDTAEVAAEPTATAQDINEQVTHAPEPTASRSEWSTEEVNEAAFVLGVQSNTDIGKNLTRDDIIELGHTACELLDLGQPNSFQQFVEQSMAAGITEDSAADWGYITGAAIAAFCPEWSSIAEESVSFQ